jgi:hypothetical protein
MLKLPCHAIPLEKIITIILRRGGKPGERTIGP